MFGSRVSWLVLVILVFAISPVGAVFADGVIIPIPPPDVPIERIPMLTIKYHRVNVTIDEQVATTQIDQVFITEVRLRTGGDLHLPSPRGCGNLRVCDVC